MMKPVSYVGGQSVQRGGLMQSSRRLGVLLPGAAVSAVMLSLCGCGVGVSSLRAPQAGPALSGRVHGGQQPVSGATIQMYAVGSGGYGSAATPMLTTTVSSGADGSFNVTGDYTCPAASTQVYITATGGNPGLPGSVSNPALALMTALGPCGNLTSSTFVNINELTTVAAVWSLAPFMSSYSGVGTSVSNVIGLTNAFASANKVVSFASGTAPGPALPAGATLPVAEVDSLANILASCVNSTGGTAGDGSACGNLFAAATPTGGTAPTDTVGAALAVARNPAQNVGTFFTLSQAIAPFQPSLAVSPANWLIGINYIGGGLSSPASLAIDAQGDVWLANKGNNSLTELANTGAPLSPTSGYAAGGLSSPAAVAIDAGGYIWLANSGNSSLSRVSSAGALLTSYTGGGLNVPDSIAIDANGDLWLGNFGTGSVSEFSNSGTPLSPSSGFQQAAAGQPSAVAINPY